MTEPLVDTVEPQQVYSPHCAALLVVDIVRQSRSDGPFKAAG